ncbi:hypothetical protein QJ054_33650 [Streptomyces sp. AN-3]|uniref:hypothetical protein n=1 Tax=Streptomyces sp. AN-3 TaxID=3044177 RepID=UPI002499C95F|nr:hypothetical protein [Streptomyces sp. AN-3]MDI3101982.1 hypothetical protein [Streptomyces sp. AN-3]MDV6291376.1 hypothetical protein [Streptomyces sp. UP1A-1]
MQTLALFDVPTAPAPAAKPRRVPLPLGELPVSSVPAAYDREHLYSPKAATAAVVDHRPGDLFGPLPAAPSGKAWRTWWDTQASVATPDFLGLEAGDEITIQHADSTGPGTVLFTCRFGAFVQYDVPASEWTTERHVDMYVTKRNQFGHWYR